MDNSWDWTKQLVEKADKGKRDFRVKITDVEWLSSDDKLQAKLISRTYALSFWAETQLCNWLRIPADYFKRCPAELKKAQLESWIPSRFGRDDVLQLRTRRKTIRAFLSASYTPFDNVEVIKLWEEFGFQRRFDHEVYHDEDFFYLRGLGIDSRKELEGRLPMWPGVYVLNSEVGDGSLRIGPGIWRSGFENMDMVGVGLSPIFRQPHIWINRETLPDRFKQAVLDSYGEAREAVRDMRKLAAIPAAEEDLDLELKGLGLPKRFNETVRGVFAHESKPSMLTVIDAITFSARRLPPHDRYRIENMAGWVMDRKTRRI